MPSPFECYACYCALKRHFSKWDYDFHQYRGKSRGVTPESFQKRKDKGMFVYLSHHHPKPFDFLLAHLSHNPNKWIGEIIKDKDLYMDYQRRNEALSYLFEQEVNVLPEPRNTIFDVPFGGHPILMRYYLAKRVSLQSACLMLKLSGQGEAWRQAAEGDILFNDVTIRLVRFAPFMKFNKEKIHQILVDYGVQNAKYILEDV
jgi:hypothetical protein